LQGIIEQEEDPTLKASDEDSKNWDQPLIIAEPELRITTITPDDQFLLLACDGLFDVFTPEDVIQFVKTDMESHGDSQKCCQVSQAVIFAFFRSPVY
jgi:serine/threonine protein phosphatase PrpC